MQKGKSLRQESFTDQLRAAIISSDYRMIDIARETETEPAVISRFMNGKAGMNLKTLDRIAALLKLRIVAPTKKSKGK